MHHAAGTFEVKVAPAEASEFEKAAGLSRYTLEKTLHGDLEGTARGEMLASAEEANGAMMYVAVDKVTGTLHGKQGGFTLLHRATMIKGDAASAKMEIVIAAGSGTGELAGIAGTFTIVIDAKGGHSYTMEYTLP
jgi:hypothetical protein